MAGATMVHAAAIWAGLATTAASSTTALLVTTTAVAMVTVHSVNVFATGAGQAATAATRLAILLALTATAIRQTTPARAILVRHTCYQHVS